MTSPFGTYYPGTNNLVTHSYSEAEYSAEFDDALVDQAPWKNPRYDGSKLTGKKINEYTPSSSAWSGDITYSTLPVIRHQITALYIANTCIGGLETQDLADIKNHSYVGINKILICNHVNDTVHVIARAAEPFTEFHRFITNDLPTGAKVKIKIIDQSIGTMLKGTHRVKMNKGWLLKSFTFKYAGETSSSLGILAENNSMYFYKSGSFQDNFYKTGSVVIPEPDKSSQRNQLRFRYAVNEMFPAGTSSGVYGHKFGLDRLGPSFASSSINENKYTIQYYSGSFDVPILHQPAGSHYSDILLSTGLGSASKFLAVDSLNFLTSNNNNTSLLEEQKTEIHITFFQGSKDFAPGWHDERSIGTFEIDQNQSPLQITSGDGCNGGLPTHHELVFKGPDDNRFIPTTSTFTDEIQIAHLQSTASDSTASGSYLATRVGCTAVNDPISQSRNIQSGVTIDKVEKMEVYAQGGVLGQIGFVGCQSASIVNQYIDPPIANSSYGVSQINNMTVDNLYSGSFSYEMSFLEKDHTVIVDIDKETELQSGIGTLGLVLIPDNTVVPVKFDLEYWLQKAGIIGTTGPGQTQQNVQSP